MSDLVFPALPGIGWDIDRSWEWKNAGRDSESGRSFKRAMWTTPRRHYRLRIDVLRSGAEAELQQLVGFFNRHKGSYETWLFDDPIDNTATQQTLGASDGTRVNYQLVRAFGGHQQAVFDLNGAISLYADHLDGGGIVPLTGITFTVSAGMVTLSAPLTSGHVLYWSGKYYWRCEFSDDRLSAKEFLQALHSSGVDFRTYKP